MAALRSSAKRVVAAVVARLPWALTPARLRDRALRLRAQRVTGEGLARPRSLSTATLVALLLEVPSGAVPVLAAVADELGSRAIGHGLRPWAIEGIVRARRFDLLADVAGPDGRRWHGLSGPALVELADLLTRDEAPTLAELTTVAGDGRDALVGIGHLAAGARRWPVASAAVARLGIPGGGRVPPELFRWAFDAARDGELSAAVAIDEALGRPEPNLRYRRTLDRARDDLEILGTDLSTLRLDARDPVTARAGAVLYVASQSLPHRTGGYATRTHGIVSALARRGWDVRGLTRLGFPYDRWSPSDARVVAEHDEIDGIEYHRALRGSRREYPQVPLLDYVRDFADDVAQQARDHGAEVIHAASFFQTGLAAALAANALGIPFVYEIRGFDELFRVSRNPDYADTEGDRVLRALETEVCRRADVVLCITEAIAADVESRGIPRERLRVLANGVEPNEFSPTVPDAELRRELGLEGKVVIGYAGSLVDYEGLDLLCDAVAALDRDDIAVVIVGDGAHAGALRRHVQGTRADSFVTFVGRVPHDQVARYLSVFDVMPFPRLPMPVTEEVSPMKPFEAMAMQKAVIVSSVAALVEIVVDGETGIVFDKGDVDSLAAAIARLADDPVLRAELGARARTYIDEQADWYRRVAVADDAYRELGARRG